jgi:hypothetical protein
VQVAVVILVLLETEVENPDGINRLQPKIPVTALYGLLLDGKRGVIDTSVLEIVLFGMLYLHDEFFAVQALTIQIEDGFALVFTTRQLLAFFVVQYLYLILFGQQLIEKIDEQLLVELIPK